MPDLRLEQNHTGLVAGIDEVGRGPLAGPVMAAAFVFKDTVALPDFTKDIKDSKKLSKAKREAIYHNLMQTKGMLCEFAIASASVAEIDQMNILQATLLAMQRAFASLPLTPSVALIDGKQAPNIPCPTISVIQGDQISLSIAAASIVAKVTRDRYMHQLAQEYPQYLWQNNAGYGTRDHLQALQHFGPTPHHRMSFAPVRQAALQSSASGGRPLPSYRSQTQ